MQPFCKETPAQVFSCEIYAFLRTSFFTEQLQWLLLLRILIVVLKQLKALYLSMKKD